MTAAEEPSTQQSSAQSFSAQQSHDSFLELLRNVSVLRVVFLHLVLRPPLIYLPWIQWIYPGMPEIFFVAGTLMSYSLRRRSAKRVVVDRVRRVLFPYCVYAVVAVVAMLITDKRSANAGATFTNRSVLSFIVPIFEPNGSSTRIILWSHLWFVTAFLWLIALSPLLARLVKRIGIGSVLLPLVCFAVSIAVRKLTTVEVPGQITNISQFGVFYMLGMVAGDGRLGKLSLDRPTARNLWLLIGSACAVGGVVTAIVIEPIAKKHPAELYASKSAYLLIGTAWLALALAFHKTLSKWTSQHPNRWLRACTQRTFTLYLWGLPADAIGTAVAKRFLPNRLIALPIYVLVSIAALCVAVVAVGWVEDLSARRKLRLLPTLSSS
jgi:peptidoglycan-N-acetylglucosamine deacetylase